MSIQQRICPIPGCPARIGDKLMCGAHWRQVPKNVQREVLRQWGEYQRTSLHWEEYKSARTDAINSVSNHPRPGKEKEPVEACFIKGCTASGRKYLPVCDTHWNQLPTKLRAEIHDAMKPSSGPMDLYVARKAANAYFETAQEPHQ